MVFVNGYNHYTAYIQLFKPAARADVFNAKYCRQINFKPFAVISVFLMQSELSDCKLLTFHWTL